MKIYINKIFVFLVISVFLGSCEDREIITLDSNAVPVATLSESEVVLDPANLGQDVLTVTWSKLDYGFKAADTFEVLFDLAGGDFSAAQIKNVGNNFSLTLKSEELNAILTNLGVEPNVPTQIVVMVKSVLSNQVGIDSATQAFTGTTYPDKLDLSTPWGIVGSAYNDWGGDGPDAPFYTIPGETDKIVSYVTLLDGKWKIRKDNAWDLNYGDTGADGTLEEGGDDIVVTAGTYKILFDTVALTYTIEAYSWGLIGDATPNGWNPPDTKLIYDPLYDNWKTTVTLADGKFKVRFNEDWGTNYGSDNADGTLQKDGADIPAIAGNYSVTVDFNELTYKLTPVE